MRHIGFTGEIDMPALAEGCAAGVTDKVVIDESWDWHFGLKDRLPWLPTDCH